MLWMKEWTFMDCRLIIDNWVRLSPRTSILGVGWKIYWINCMVCIYIFKINLRTRYHQMKVKEVVILKTVLITWNGYYELSYVFWGLTNTPEILMDLMNGVILLYLERFVIIFIDNILVYLNNKDNHGKCLRMVL